MIEGLPVVRSDAATELADLGAVICTRNRADLAIDCVRSLQPQLRSDNVVVLINDPDSTSDRDVQALQQVATVVLDARPQGYGASLNRGFADLPPSCSRILLLNEDLVFEPGALNAMLDALNDPEVGLVGPAILDVAGAQQPAAFSFPSVRSELAWSAIAPEVITQRVRRGQAMPLSPGPARYVDWVLGAAMLTRREAYEDVGGLDPFFFLYSEETDLALRLAKRSWRTVGVGDAHVVHLGASSTASPRFDVMLGENRAAYITRHWSRGQRVTLDAGLLLVFAWNVLYVALRALRHPGQSRERWSLFRAHWVRRPGLRRRRRVPRAPTAVSFLRV